MFEPPLDPEEFPGTPEYDERVQARRLTRQHYEEMVMDQEQIDYDSRFARRPGR